MKRRLAAVLVALAIIFVSLGVSGSSDQGTTKIYTEGDSGEMIVRIQLRLRELGYLCYRPTGVYRSMTVDAVRAFQARCGSYGNNLAVDGKLGPQTMKYLFEIGAPRVAIPDSVHMPRGPIAERLAVTGQLVEWSQVKPMLVNGVMYSVTDCNTGESFTLVFTGGDNHAEMELSDESQLEVFDRICGGEYNFLKRPVIVEVNGTKIAASMQCWPHGSDTLRDNGMSGHVCVFFEGSLSHVGSLPDVEHNANINQASGR
ncbi:MAG: peptidoglycan-binding protein [Clostridia bacterium]|nr:peptidoglycan-binding protein [Clostridia bacterium]MBR6006445.1 peptidoglycan-binding protein [Clostridia bacterium]